MEQVSQNVEQQREEEPKRGPLSRILERAAGGPDAGDMVIFRRTEGSLQRWVPESWNSVVWS